MRDDNGNRPVRPVRTYASLDAAYKHFNRHLFGGLLPSCILTLQRHKGAFGYFVPERMAELDDGEDQAVDEIALNPAAFEGRSPMDILSTLVHEMRTSGSTTTGHRAEDGITTPNGPPR